MRDLGMNGNFMVDEKSGYGYQTCEKSITSGN